MKILSVILTLLVYVCASSAQQIKVTGTIRDADTHEPIPFVNIRVAGSSLGTSSDRIGKYILSLAPGRHEIVYTFIGYHTVKQQITVGYSPMIRDVDLKQGSVELEAIEITPQENPAIRIIKEAIARKAKRKEKIERYSLTSHSKLVAEMKELSGPVSVSINQMKLEGDSSLTMIMESQTDAYWEKPDKYKEIVRARKQSAFIPSANNLLISGFFIVDFSGDIIRMADKKIVGPISNTGLDNYFYTLLGKMKTDEDTIYKINITPIDESDPLLSGTIYIAQGKYQLMSVDVELNNAARPQFITNISFRQQFSLFENEFWMPVDVAVRGDVNVNMIVTLNLHFEAFSVLQNYKINTPFESEEVFDKTRIKILPEADKRDSSYWSQHQAIPSTTQEVEQYRKSDSIKVVMEVKRNEVDVSSLIFGKDFGRDQLSVSVPGLLSLYRFNRVEGHSLYFPIETSNLYTNLDRLNFDIGYGFDDKKVKYNSSLRYRISSNPRYTASMNIFSINSWIDRGVLSDNYFNTTLLNLLWKYDYKDYFYQRGWSAGVQGDVFPIINAFIGFTQSTYRDATKNTDWSIFRRDIDHHFNPSINEGTIRSLRLSLSLDTRDYIDNAGVLSRLGGGIGQHFFSVGAEISQPDFIASDFTFTLFTASLIGSFDLRLFGHTRYRLFGGIGTGSVPTQKIFNFIPSIPYLSSQWKFRTLDFREFSGDRIATLFVEHNFKDQIFRWLQIPLLKSSGWGLVFFGSAGWSDIRSESFVLQTIPTRTANTPFYEIGFGIDQIFLLFRLDVAWRMNHFRNGKNFMIGISSPFTGN